MQSSGETEVNHLAKKPAALQGNHWANNKLWFNDRVPHRAPSPFASFAPLREILRKGSGFPLYPFPLTPRSLITRVDLVLNGDLVRLPVPLVSRELFFAKLTIGARFLAG
jgi:hypothetical protein